MVYHHGSANGRHGVSIVGHCLPVQRKSADRASPPPHLVAMVLQVVGSLPSHSDQCGMLVGEHVCHDLPSAVPACC